MTIGVLVILVFVAVTAGVVGMFMLMSGRSQVQREKAIQQPPAGSRAAPPRRRRAGAGSGTLLLKEIVGPMPNMDRVATRGAERFGRRAVAPAVGHGDDHQRRAS